MATPICIFCNRRECCHPKASHYLQIFQHTCLRCNRPSSHVMQARERCQCVSACEGRRLCKASCGRRGESSRARGGCDSCLQPVSTSTSTHAYSEVLGSRIHHTLSHDSPQTLTRQDHLCSCFLRESPKQISGFGSVQGLLSNCLL